MELHRASNGQQIFLDTTGALGSGGEATVYAVPPDDRLAAKVYHRPKPYIGRKLAVMTSNPPVDPMATQGGFAIAWPVDTLLSGPEGDVVGFLMPRVLGCRPVFEYYNPGVRRRHCPLFNYLYLHRTARNLAAVLAAIHARGYVIGDINESNILVSDSALVTLVDTDSFQVRDPVEGTIYRCPVGKVEFTPAELAGQPFAESDRTPEHDRFGLGVLLFLLLMEGVHPFAGFYTGEEEPPPFDARIRDAAFPFSARPGVCRPLPSSPPFDLLAPELQALFLRCFEEGHANPDVRPTAEEWVAALQSAENALVVCRVNDQHVFGSHLLSCPWCERTRLLGKRDPFPARAVVSGESPESSLPVQTALTPAGAPLVQRVEPNPPANLGLISLAGRPAAPDTPTPRDKATGSSRSSDMGLLSFTGRAPAAGAAHLTGSSSAAPDSGPEVLRESTVSPPMSSSPFEPSRRSQKKVQEINFRNSPVVGLVAAAVAIAAPIIAWYCTAPLRIGDEVAAKIAAKRRDSPPAPLRARARPEMAALSPGLPRRQRSPVANAGSALRRDAPVRTPPEPSKPSTPPRVVLAAAARGDVAALSSIIAADPAAVGAVNKDGWTPLHFAAYKDQSAAVSLLLNLSADVNANEKDGFTPLMLAAQEGHAAVVGILLQHGADVGHREKTGWTALHFAAQEGHLEVVQSLLRSGADVNTRDENGLTALAVAERERRDSIAAVLRRAGGIK